MQKIIQFFSVILLLTGSIAVHAQTNVSGTISSNTTWTISGSPYILTDLTGIPAGVTLTIQPGVQVSGAFDLLVKGTLICNGKSDSLIKVSSTRVLFKSAVLTNSQMKYMNFNNSGGIQLADESASTPDIVKNSGSLTVDHSTFSSKAYTTTKGYQSSASFLINDSKYSDATIEGYYPLSEPIVLTNCEIDKSSINSDSYNYGITLNACIVTGSNFIAGCCNANFHISGCTIANGSFNADNGSSVFITNSKIVNTPCYFIATNNVSVSNSVISGGANHMFVCYNLTMTNVEIKGAGVSNGLELYGNNTIHSCNISGMDKGIIFNPASGTNSLTIDSSNISNNATYNMENKLSTGIVAKNNFWGDTTASLIDNKIIDGNDNINLGLVDYTGYLKTPYTIAPMTPLAYLVKRKVSGGVQLKWKAVKEKDVSGYKIYYGNPTGYSFSNSVNVGNVNSYFLPTIAAKDPIAITAYDIGMTGTNDQVTGRESWFSDFTIAGIGNLDSMYCTNSASSSLSATPVGGIFSGPGISGHVFNPAAAGPGKHEIFYVYPSPGGDDDTVSAFVTVFAAPIGGSLNVTQDTICSGDYVGLTLFGYSGILQWQVSTSPSSWTNIPGATGSSYTTPTLTSTHHYRVVLTNGACAPAFSTIASIIVNPTSYAGTISVNKKKFVLETMLNLRSQHTPAISNGNHPLTHLPGQLSQVKLLQFILPRQSL